MSTFTPLEARVLAAAKLSSNGNGHDFGLIEDVVAELPDLKPQAIGALFTSLQKKRVLRVYEPVTTDSGTWTQFILADEHQT